jgi:nicotinamide-nucleotide amidase
LTETLRHPLPQDLDEYAERLMRRVCDRNLMVATAESCTGGMLAALLTDIEGAGHGFDRGFVTYEPRSKQDLLGLTPEMTDRNEAVTSAVARAMAEGALQNSHADIALSVTGFAGPTRQGEEGLVHFGCARRGESTLLREEHFGALGRGRIRIAALRALLEMLEEALDEAAPAPA